MIDTHTHIYLEDFDEDRSEVIERAKDSGITKLLLPNVDPETVNRLHELCDQHPGFCFPMMGLHPTGVNQSWKEDLGTIRSWFDDKRKYIAVGEIGIDLYWDKTYIEAQKQAFIEQLRWSIEMDLPVVIHTRDAFPEVFECLNFVGAHNLRGVFHSFGGSREELEQALQYKNFMLGINGVVTFKNSIFREYLNLAPIERIVTETDAPYLTPMPFRGKRNEPAYISYVVEKLAEIYQLSPETVAKKTAENAERMFNLHSSSFQELV
ncbi:MAG: TatD family hydrolase [Dysgonamonadaceae bacterium]|jgi:TatD DNase family protein|nr:TatD family hydrolase [Dysgonamonadaceae bacterium]